MSYSALRVIRFMLAMVVAVSLPLGAEERVRVVVAVGLPEVSARGITALRANVIESLETARGVERWGRGRVFAADVTLAELERLQRDPRVKAVSIDDGGEGALLESLPLIGAEAARTQGFDGRGVTVAVLDTGIDARNRDFEGRIAAEACFCDNLDGTGCCPGGASVLLGEGAADDDHGHGTHVAGIIAGGGAWAPQGLAPKANLVAVKVMDAANGFRSFTQIYRALSWIATERPDVRVINMSLGSHALFSTSSCGSAAIAMGMQEIIAELRGRGVLITASTGNQSSTTGTTLPACMYDVLGVGATYDASGDHHDYCPADDVRVDQVACFTNSTDAVDILAPGASIVASRRGGGSVVLAGTSMAAPHVAGAIALLVQASGGLLTADGIETILETTGKPVMDSRNEMLFPRLDLAAAIAATPRPPAGGRRRAVRK